MLPPVIPSKLLDLITDPSLVNSRSTRASPSPSLVISTEIVTVLPSISSPEIDKESKDKSASVVIISRSENVSLPGVFEFAITLTSAVSPSVNSIYLFKSSTRLSDYMSSFIS